MIREMEPTGAAESTGADARDLDGDRWVRLTEVDNVRDLGGLPLPTGGHTRFGVAYRASTLQQSVPADVAELVQRRGLRTILDLRLPDEAAREGHGLFGDAGLEVVSAPIRKTTDTGLDVVVPDTRTTDLGVLYQQLLAGSTDSIVTAARVVADPSRQGVLFHCAAGKDRTGVVAAVLLDAVGVAGEDIVADYVLTSERAPAIRERLVSIPAYRNLPPVANGVMSVDGEAIRQLVRALHEQYGGAGRFLLDNGLSAAELASLRATLGGTGTH
ncbi:tyrosine-protein phosphatase [Nocardioides sambongensis]|uniref:tyrosine-protein phosphatase n=1 Tax=Nocardioides sambongensis TaxID=2589074 RepID=UPI001126AE05|nr:tyrosine-protein phosphatase [Nocardioides sambongensis]